LHAPNIGAAMSTTYSLHCDMTSPAVDSSVCLSFGELWRRRFLGFPGHGGGFVTVLFFQQLQE
jgi:hypothetical protein